MAQSEKTLQTVKKMLEKAKRNGKNLHLSLLEYGVRYLQPLKAGEAVCVKHAEGEWGPAKVIEIADAPRSYLIKTSEGGIYRRNRRSNYAMLKLQISITKGDTRPKITIKCSGETFFT